MENYEELLSRVYSKLPKKEGTGERFVMPTVETVTIGHQTIIKNFGEVAAALRRDPKHLLKFLSKELATPANIDGNRALLQAKLPQRSIQTKLDVYVKEFIICRECKRPDTRLEKAERITILVCEACGARSAVKQI
ncbi:MAG: translation initiation factor IF-2 subunit beta [Candidatus Aenigmatarchaeota archaeon]|nr:translation initiation factor IF-2 subunit beta [Candidatus Aenigmarchaeota archaeon]